LFELLSNGYVEGKEDIVMSLVMSDDVLAASGLNEESLLTEVILMLFQQDRLSLGKAAALLEISQVRFQRLLTEHTICIHYDVAEFREDVAYLRAKRML